MLRSALLLSSLALTGCSALNPNAPINKQAGTAVVPFLLFQDGRAEEAMRFYAGLFDYGSVLSVERYGPDRQGPEESLFLGSFEVGGQTVRCTDSPIPHDFGFTPSVSLFVDCASEAEIGRLCEALSESGELMMPLGDYGFSKKFAWVQDRYGVSWQLNLPSEDE